VQDDAHSNVHGLFDGMATPFGPSATPPPAPGDDGWSAAPEPGITDEHLPQHSTTRAQRHDGEHKRRALRDTLPAAAVVLALIAAAALAAQHAILTEPRPATIASHRPPLLRTRTVATARRPARSATARRHTQGHSANSRHRRRSARSTPRTPRVSQATPVTYTQPSQSGNQTAAPAVDGPSAHASSPPAGSAPSSAKAASSSQQSSQPYFGANGILGPGSSPDS